MKLPVNVPFHPENETPLSLASRMARAMSFPSVEALLGSVGITSRAVERGEEQAMRTLSTWSGVSAETIVRFAVPKTVEAGEWQLGDAIFRKEMRVAGRVRFCPHCFVEDIEVGSGQPRSRPYERASWTTRGVTACIRHGNLLVEAHEDAPTGDIARFVAEGWHHGNAPEAVADEADMAVDLYVEKRIAGGRDGSFIDRQEVHMLLALFNFIGWLIHSYLPDLLIGRTAASAMSAKAAGFHVAVDGWEAIEEVIRKAISLRRPPATTITEFFGPMVRHMRRNAEVPAYREIVALLQDLVERTVPVGPGDRFILPVERRCLHSVRSASHEYGIDSARIRKQLEQRAVIPCSRLADASVYFGAGEAHEILTGLAQNRTSVEVAAVLGTHEHRVRELIERGLLTVSERGVTDDRPFYRVSNHDLEGFLIRVFDDKPVKSEDYSLLSLSAASRRRSLTQTDMIEMILNGRLKSVARVDESRTLGSLLVDLRELPISAEPDSIEEEDRTDYYSLSEVEKALSTTTVTVTALVKEGVLPVEVRTNPRSFRRQPFVPRHSVEAFLDGHRSLHLIARGWRRNIALMRDELDQNGLEPIFETSGKIARYYRIEDLAKAHLLPPNA